MHYRRGRVRRARVHEDCALANGVGDDVWTRVAAYGFPGLWLAERFCFRSMQVRRANDPRWRLATKAATPRLTTPATATSQQQQ